MLRYVVNGVERTWDRVARERAACIICGGLAFKRSRLAKGPWYCKGCNEQYDGGKPYFPMTLCSKHGLVIDESIDRDVSCPECEEEAFTAGGTMDAL